MGIGAYNRGSAAISDSIQRDYMENRGGYSKQINEQMLRAEQKVMALEQFCIEAQSLYVDVTDKATSKGLLKGWMHEVWLKKQSTKRFKFLLTQCVDAHCAWVNSDHRNVFIHLSICKRKARVWLEILLMLNSQQARYTFTVPSIR
jgi:hypothetical protein